MIPNFNELIKIDISNNTFYNELYRAWICKIVLNGSKISIFKYSSVNVMYMMYVDQKVEKTAICKIGFSSKLINMTIQF